MSKPAGVPPAGWSTRVWPKPGDFGYRRLAKVWRLRLLPRQEYDARTAGIFRGPSLARSPLSRADSRAKVQPALTAQKRSPSDGEAPCTVPIPGPLSRNCMSRCDARTSVTPSPAGIKGTQAPAAPIGTHLSDRTRRPGPTLCVSPPLLFVSSRRAARRRLTWTGRELRSRSGLFTASKGSGGVFRQGRKSARHDCRKTTPDPLAPDRPPDAPVPC